MFFNTFFKGSSLIPQTSATIHLFSSSVESAGLNHVFDLRCAHKNESQDVISGKRGGEKTGSPITKNLQQSPFSSFKVQKMTPNF